VLKNIALEIHSSILANRGLSGEALHQHMLSCGYTLNDQLGAWVYQYSGNNGPS
jgi:hypothetical protein